jgi:hypothetical protein
MKKRSKALHEMDPIRRLKIQQQEAESIISRLDSLPYAGAKLDNSKDYQGPMGRGARGGTKDAMPGTTGFTYSSPNFIERLLDALKIKPYQHKKIKITPTKRPTEKRPGVI